MKKRVYVLFLAFALLLLSVAVLAQTNQKQQDRVFRIPNNAVQISDGVYSLGATDFRGEKVQGYMFVDRREFAKQGKARNGGGTCFAFLAKGARWRSNPEPWIVNTANVHGLSNNFVFSNLATNIQKWENAAGVDILGNGATTSDLLTADTLAPDGKNEVFFGSIESPGAIAVTVVWGTFSGPVSQRKLVEWDQVYDEIDFAWSSSGEAGKMDFENIATHEIGHAVGMGHPSDACTEETMYRFADFGETKKRTLNAGDIAGIKELYK